MDDTTKKLLLVDDEEDIRDILTIILTDMGYDVLTAGDGKAALEIFRKEFPLLVVTDIKMPGMDGIELLKAMKSESPDTEVIMITGHGDMELAVRSLKYEANDFVTKPINDDILDAALRRAGERITMRRQLREYTENLESLVQEKTRRLVETERMAAVGQTSAGMAHAIKNIIGGLTGGIYVLDKGFELNNRSYIHQGWKMVKSNVDRINRLASDLLNFSRDPSPSYRHCDPNGPVREVYDLMLPRAEASNIELALELDTDLPHEWIDPEGIHRVLLNLVNNAVYACLDIRCTRKEKRIVLRTRRDGEWAVEYQVEDTGCGMDRAALENAFRTFFTTKGYDGTGLGLMMSKRIVDAHGGEISLNSEEGVGTIFYVRVPRRSVLK